MKRLSCICNTFSATRTLLLLSFLVVSLLSTKTAVSGWIIHSQPQQHQVKQLSLLKSTIANNRRIQTPTNNNNNKNIQHQSLIRLNLFGRKKQEPEDQHEKVSICIIGGGVSGLTAALTIAKEQEQEQQQSSNTDTINNNKIVLLESTSTLGGRVQSDITDDGYILDKGFAVFIEEYPYSKQLLNYEALQLYKFLPGALVKIKNNNELQRVADPLRIPTDLFTALLAPIGTLLDKINIVRLIIHVRTTSVDDIFNEIETSTLDALQNRWNFSNEIIIKFFRPFLEGIYLAPLNEQSSLLFTFIFKMFSEGSATLPFAGIGAVAQQLVSKVTNDSSNSITIKTNQIVQSIQYPNNNDNKKKNEEKNDDVVDDDVYYKVLSDTGKVLVEAKSIIIATDGSTAKDIISTIPGYENLQQQENITQRSVGCLYYSFQGVPPVSDPILILNGEINTIDNGGDESSLFDPTINPINNLCFPSVVCKNYAPAGYNLCSVTILQPVLDYFKDNDNELDTAVRQQLQLWFPTYNIQKDWTLQKIYKIVKAQPSQYTGIYPANINNGRLCNYYYNKLLPNGIYICGDYVATSTLNGAFQSGINAGIQSYKFINRSTSTSTSTSSGSSKTESNTVAFKKRYKK